MAKATKQKDVSRPALAVGKSGKKSCQVQSELDGLLDCFKDCTSYLEIGARFGDTFYEVVSRMPEGSKAVCVEYPEKLWGMEGSLPILRERCKELRDMGYEIQLIIGDSTDKSVVEKVSISAPFDCALIDGDHTYKGVSTDFMLYSPLCKMIAFHDIVGEGQRHSEGIYIEVPRFWRDVKTPRCREFVAEGSQMGIGVWIP